MFPRIFFIFFLVISPSFGNESEGPSETECRPYIEKALQREGVTQETTPPIDDVGEPPQLGESIDGSKEDAASGEEASGSAESPPELSSEVPISDETVLDTGSPEPSVQLLTEELAEPSSGENNAEESGEPSSESTEAPEMAAVLSDEPGSEHSTGSAEQSGEIAENANAADENQKSETISEQAPMTGSSETEEELSSEKSEETVGSEEAEELKRETAGETVEESSERTPEAEGAPQEAETVVGVSEEAPSTNEAQSVEEAASADEVASGEEDHILGEAPVESETSDESTPAEPAEVTEDKIEPDEPLAKSDEQTAGLEEVSSEGSGDVSAEGAPVDEPAVMASAKLVESEQASSEPDSQPVAPPVEEQEVQSLQAESAASEVLSPPSVTQPEAASTDIPVAETEPEALPSEASPEPNTEADPLSEGQDEPVAPEENAADTAEGGSEPQLPEEELIMPIEIPSNLRSRDHMIQILGLAPGSNDKEKLLAKTVDNTLKELKKLYDVAIKPLEILYKYRDLSNRHFGDPEIFSKPLILFMGPWSGGKSTIINYLLENEFKKTALRSGAEPSPAYFNIVMHGEKEEILDGTQLAADWTFSGLQKFGQGLLDRLRGLRLNHPLLEKVNIVEIPGILEIRKQVERLFPFNDACQWFIDRADIIFLVYDPSKLDVGPETEAILDQLKGREMQTRIILNKADQVKPEELMRVQGTLIWNISPLMSSTEPPVMYSTSLWSLPYEQGAPSRLLYAQECGFLKDLREAIEKRVENKIASARRFAVRVRNHAKMVDCYLTTYYNHKSFFGNKKKVSDDIIEHPQNYHIYEGLSTLTNISRYDLPDPDVYKDFFRLNPVYEFQQLSATCTYFRGCPINRLDVAIAYDLPELVGKYKKQVEELLNSRK